MQVSYLIVDKENEDLDMAEDPFLEVIQHKLYLTYYHLC